MVSGHRKSSQRRENDKRIANEVPNKTHRKICFRKCRHHSSPSVLAQDRHCKRCPTSSSPANVISHVDIDSAQRSLPWYLRTRHRPKIRNIEDPERIFVSPRTRIKHRGGFLPGSASSALHQVDVHRALHAGSFASRSGLSIGVAVTGPDHFVLDALVCDLVACLQIFGILEWPAPMRGFVGESKAHVEVLSAVLEAEYSILFRCHRSIVSMRCRESLCVEVGIPGYL